MLALKSVAQMLRLCLGNGSTRSVHVRALQWQTIYGSPGKERRGSGREGRRGVEREGGRREEVKREGKRKEGGRRKGRREYGGKEVQRTRE